MPLVKYSHLLIAAIPLAMSVFGTTAWTAPITDAALVTNTGAPITDADFSNIMASNLIKNGSPNCLASIFLMEQCFGGGFDDNLIAALPNIPYVFGSASSATESSWGPAGAGLDYWTAALIPELAKPTQGVRLSTDAAAANDTRGPNGTKKETPVSDSQNNGFQVFLADPNAQSYDAVLWAGNPDPRHQTDVTGIYNTIKAAWAATGKTATIKILYGNGTTPGGTPWTNNGAATRTNLVNTMAGLPLSGSAEFLFYATDHGSKVVPVAAAHGAVPGGNSDVEHYTLDPATVSVIDAQQGEAASEGDGTGFNPFAPYIEVDYDGVASDGTVGVFAGSDFLGFLPAADSVFDFNIPYADIGLADSITVTDGGSSSFDLDGETFFADADTQVDAPEPASLGMLAVGVLLIGRRRGMRPR
jgi:hypothetical protein